MKKIYFVIMKTLYNVAVLFLSWIIIGFMLVGFINSIAGEIEKMSYEDYAQCSFIYLTIFAILYFGHSYEKNSNKEIYDKKLNAYVLAFSVVGFFSLLTLHEIIAATLDSFANLPPAIPVIALVIVFGQCTVPDF